MEALVIFVGLAFDHAAAFGAAAEVGWPFRCRVGLALQGVVEHLLGQHLTNGLDRVFDLGEFGAPGRPLVAIQAIDEAFGDAFEVGSNGISGGGVDLVASHPWHLSEEW